MATFDVEMRDPGTATFDVALSSAIAARESWGMLVQVSG